MEQILLLSSVLLWILVLCNLLLTLTLIRRTIAGPRIEQGLKEGTVAPDFIAHTLSGETRTLTTYAQQELVLIFLSPTCQPCIEALPTYKTLEPKARASGVTLILVSLAEAEQTHNFVNEHNINLPILIAPRETNSFMNDYKLLSTPSFCFINKRGKVQFTGQTNNFRGTPWKRLTDSWEQNAILVSSGSERH